MHLSLSIPGYPCGSYNTLTQPARSLIDSLTPIKKHLSTCRQLYHSNRVSIAIMLATDQHNCQWTFYAKLRGNCTYISHTQNGESISVHLGETILSCPHPNILQNKAKNLLLFAKSKTFSLIDTPSCCINVISHLSHISLHLGCPWAFPLRFYVLQ